MPTALKRTQVTHVPQLQLALNKAARAWPEVATSDSALITRLALRGAAEIDSETESLLAARLAPQPAYSGAFGERFLDELRDGWPQ